MLLHSIFIGCVLYIIMIYIFNQPSKVAEDRSLLLASIVLIYMLLFGHKIPGQINTNIL